MKRIELKNFQCHKDLELILEPGVNVMVGPSDTGKSSVYRALYWMAFNRPSGDSFLRHGAKEVSVTVESEEHSVVRKKSKTVNEYEVDGQVQKAIGTDVPGPVNQVLNLQPINFQGQHDAPFLLSETAGEVGRMLNRMVDLEEIDRTLAGLNRRQWDLTRDIDLTQSHTEEMRRQRGMYDRVAAMEECLGKARKAAEQVRQTQAEAGALNRLLSDASRHRSALDAFPDTSAMEEALKRAGRQRDTAEKAREKAEGIGELVGNIGQLQESIRLKQKKEQELEEAFKEEMGEVCPLCGQKVSH